MHIRNLLRLSAVAVLLVLSALPSGCGRRTEVLDRWEERDPLLKRAKDRRLAGDVDGALELYNKALDRRPTLALAHLAVGLIYQQDKQDYVRAIYHFQRYLELRPQAEKRKLVEDSIRWARLSFAASLPDPPPGALEHIAMLERKVKMLESQVAQAGGKPPPAAAPAAAARPSPAAAVAPSGGIQPPKPEPAQPAVETYVVQSGDTLSKIAAKVYKNPDRWKQIYEANRNTLGSPENVRVGQTLILPR